MTRGKVQRLRSIWKAKRRTAVRMTRRGWFDSMTPEEKAEEVGRWVHKGATQCRCDYCYPHVGGLPDHKDKRADADMADQLSDIEIEEVPE